LLEGLLPFLFFIITVSAHTKKKQAIALSCRIEDSTSAVEIKPCFVCISSSYKYVFDQSLSGRYSEYYRQQVSCDKLSDE
jgi:hypothetical protein